MYSPVFCYSYPVLPFITLHTHRIRAQNTLFDDRVFTWIIQIYEILYIPDRNCDEYRTYIRLYTQVFLYIHQSLLLMHCSHPTTCAVEVLCMPQMWRISNKSVAFTTCAEFMI